MNCRECELLLADAEGNALAEDHLRGCATCRALQEDLRANALALSSLRDDELPRVTMPERRPAVARPIPWIAAAAAAVLLALIARQGLQRQSPHPAAVPTPVTVTAKLPATSEPAAKPVLRRKPAPARRSAQEGQPLLVKMLTPDPDVVVYWIVD
jgi:hypothetical protein